MPFSPRYTSETGQCPSTRQMKKGGSERDAVYKRDPGSNRARIRTPKAASRGAWHLHRHTRWPPGPDTQRGDAGVAWRTRVLRRMRGARRQCGSQLGASKQTTSQHASQSPRPGSGDADTRVTIRNSTRCTPSRRRPPQRGAGTHGLYTPRRTATHSPAPPEATADPRQRRVCRRPAAHFLSSSPVTLTAGQPAETSSPFGKCN